jgi:hypothetical protein
MSPPPRRDVDATIARLLELYEAWGKPGRAAIYRMPFVL